ncbi:MAG: hypothetical protein GWM90_28855, partial [Gemmatimonadetes bacterium]|nr:hypothetical protein [Gemmatimonadota bacterium]NIQ57461.1 hypothetical protein [Gemmatimonadota bacterium]NIU77625.1 hypothetical protein [Gammaproteobacteria bacterium]NIX47936.1 hypothetical protein [Gemmatimonadota bacterium]NIY11159.1 hypothetical protein [Gemmatimonadota bacterium]
MLESQRDRLQWMARLTGAGFVATLVTLVIVLLTVFGGNEALAAKSLQTEEVVLRDG